MIEFEFEFPETGNGDEPTPSFARVLGVLLGLMLIGMAVVVMIIALIKWALFFWGLL